jgi:hypothetical protein
MLLLQTVNAHQQERAEEQSAQDENKKSLLSKADGLLRLRFDRLPQERTNEKFDFSGAAQ